MSMPRYCAIYTCFDCPHNSYDNFEGGFHCGHPKCRQKYNNVRYICWSQEDLKTDFPEWCPLETVKEV